MFKNLTPHAVNILDTEGKNIVTLDKPIQGTELPRVSTQKELRFEHEGVPVSSSEFGDVDNLPDQEEGVYLVVSGMVRAALPDRKDLLSPGDLVRGADGNPVGCCGLVCNP